MNDIVSERDEMIAQRNDMMAQRDRMIAQVAVANAQLDEMTLQIAKLSSSSLKHEILAARLKEFSRDGGSGAKKLTQLASTVDALRSTYLDLMEQVLIGAKMAIGGSSYIAPIKT